MGVGEVAEEIGDQAGQLEFDPQDPCVERMELTPQTPSDIHTSGIYTSHPQNTKQSQSQTRTGVKAVIAKERKKGRCGPCKDR